MTAADGMKTNPEWDQMGHQAKVMWLVMLDAVGVRAQASVRATQTRTGLDSVLMSWVVAGYLSYERALEALSVRAVGQ